jgi:hypothetical protein
MSIEEHRKLQKRTARRAQKKKHSASAVKVVLHSKKKSTCKRSKGSSLKGKGLQAKPACRSTDLKKERKTKKKRTRTYKMACSISE